MPLADKSGSPKGMKKVDREGMSKETDYNPALSLLNIC
jgi:hypothetical protein